ncbi:LuxR C-terminal-related transcriptional regulator [Actibacterium sp.]|uniref:LuxR C-terminal-related transcriptional regulator n=1 Tax=Actibacterium sp. TaxID=1872125 RepID=UPI0035638AAC
MNTNASLAELGFLESPIAQLMLAHRQILRANRAAQTLFGYSAEALEGRSARLLYPSHADFSLIGARAEKGMSENKSYEDQRFMQMADGTICWMRARGVTLSPEDPFALTIWAFERTAEQVTRSVDLTPREQDIARHVVNGRTCKEIGLALGISHRTVEVHRARLMKKLGARNTAELVSKIIVVG